MNFEYYKSKRFDRVYYAKDIGQKTYAYRDYSWLGPKKYWRQASWQGEIAFITSEIGNKEKSERISENDLMKYKIPEITSRTTKLQSPYEYFQDNEEDWIFFSKDEEGNVFLFRDPKHPHYSVLTGAKRPSEKWEVVHERSFKEYCLDTMRATSQSTQRTEEYLVLKNIPLVQLNKVIPCVENHIQ